MPEAMQLSAGEDELHSLLQECEFATSLGHLEQAISAHTRGEWASANAQMRAFIESLFDQIAHWLSPSEAAACATSHDRRELLAKLSPPFLLPDLNEWEVGKAGGFLQGFWRRLHPGGAHPGLSDELDSTFRLHMVLLVGLDMMRRLRNRGPKPTKST
jgi:hypothetical protein